MTEASAVSPENETPPPPVARRKDMSLEHKIAMIVCVAIATIIPSYLIWGLIEERQSRQEAVQEEFTKTWGPQLGIVGPVLVVPYRRVADGPRFYF